MLHLFFISHLVVFESQGEHVGYFLAQDVILTLPMISPLYLDPTNVILCAKSYPPNIINIVQLEIWKPQEIFWSTCQLHVSCCFNNLHFGEVELTAAGFEQFSARGAAVARHVEDWQGSKIELKIC